jgi:hypothetical protein
MSFRPLLVTTLNQKDYIHSFPTYLLMIHLNVTNLLHLHIYKMS